MNKKHFIAGVIAGGFVGWTLGIIQGYTSGLDWCVEIGLKVLDLNNIDLGIKEDLLKQGVQMFKQQISNWLG